MPTSNQQAFVLRIAPGTGDKVPEALASDQIIIGWAEAPGLLTPQLSWEAFRDIIRSVYYADEGTLRKAGAAAGHMWRFIREMKEEDIVVVPSGSQFYAAKVMGPATYDAVKVTDDTVYRRQVQWLNQKKSLPRILARSPLISRMKAQGTCTYATDLLSEIHECLTLTESGMQPTFESDLLTRLTHEALQELRSGRMDSFGFERIVKDVLISLGAKEARIIPRSLDKGADILATFRIAGAFRHVVAVQAKHWLPEPPVGKDVVEQLIKGLEAESANLGMVITTGAISREATQAAEKYFDEKGIKIEMVDGEQFAKLIVEHGIRS